MFSAIFLSVSVGSSRATWYSGPVLALHYYISFGYVDAVTDSTVYLRKVLVHLEYDYIGLVQYPLGDARGTGQIEIPVVIHRRHCDHSDIYIKKMLVVLEQRSLKTIGM